MGFKTDPQGVEIVPGSFVPCPCGGAPTCSLKIPIPENAGTLEGVHEALIVCKCGREIPCKVKIDLQRHRGN